VLSVTASTQKWAGTPFATLDLLQIGIRQIADGEWHGGFLFLGEGLLRRPLVLEGILHHSALLCSNVCHNRFASRVLVRAPLILLLLGSLKREIRLHRSTCGRTQILVAQFTPGCSFWRQDKWF
jgi:hypothetical protein